MDVCYSGSILYVYDNQKAMYGKEDSINLSMSPTHFGKAKELTCSLNFIRTQPDTKEIYEHWAEYKKCKFEAEISIPLTPRNRLEKVIFTPQTMGGVIACGAVSGSEKYNELIRSAERKVLAIDTESGGVFHAASERGINALTIRGISDYADKDKNRLEDKTKVVVIELVAKNAASFLRLQLSNHRFVRCIVGFRGSSDTVPLFSDPTAVDNVGALTSRVADKIDESLRRYSPEYRLRERGYGLPVPRLRELDPLVRLMRLRRSIQLTHEMSWLLRANC